MHIIPEHNFTVGSAILGGRSPRNTRDKRSLLRLFVAATLLTCGACGSDTKGAADSGTDSGSAGSARYFELKLGANWTYRVTNDQGEVHPKTNTVEALEDVGGAWAGTRAFRLRMEDDNGATLSWQEDTGTAVRRLRDKTYDTKDTLTQDEYYKPYKLRLDESGEHLKKGATWVEDYTEYITDVATGKKKTQSRSDMWKVEAIDEKVVVPAGTFKCIRIRRVSLETSSEKFFWFARGVGKVKESGGQTEELADYQIP
jgi:hypothetical protein